MRRERTGHIKLAVPVAHIWYFRSLPNKLASLLNLKSKDLEAIIYYEKYIVLQSGVSDLEVDVYKRQLLREPISRASTSLQQ